MTPYISRCTNVVPVGWALCAAMHHAQGPVPDGELVRACLMTERQALAIRQGCFYAGGPAARTPWHPDTKRAALRRLWLA